MGTNRAGASEQLAHRHRPLSQARPRLTGYHGSDFDGPGPFSTNRVTSFLMPFPTNRTAAAAPRSGAKRTVAVCLALCVGSAVLATAGATGTAGRASAAVSLGWIDVVNAYRASSGLPGIVNNASLQSGVDKHAHYLSLSGILSHGESPSVSGYTAEGSLAAAQSVLGGWVGADHSDRDLVEGWVTAPFHLVHLLEPRLQSAAYASTHELPGAYFTSAAVLNVVGGIGPRVTLERPVLFPADGSVVSVTTFTTETPDPLVACPGYSAPTGLGIVAMFPNPPGRITSAITLDGQPVEHCMIDASYSSGDPSGQATVRSILTQKNAIVLMPRRPLTPGATYEVSINGTQSVSWTFSTSLDSSVLPLPSPNPLLVRSRIKTAASKAATKL